MFDIQRFGANDTVTSSSELKIVMEFYDSDNRTITMDNPIPTLTSAEVNAVVDWMKTNQPIVGDKSNSASLVGASSCKAIDKTVTQLDLS